MGTPELDSYLKQVGTFAALQAVSVNVSKAETDDAETLRRVRGLCEQELAKYMDDCSANAGVKRFSREVLAILNGTERKGEKR